MSQQVGELVEAVQALIKKLEAPRLPTLLTQPMAAKELSISLSKLRVLIRSGLIRTVRIGGAGHPLVSAEELRRCVKEWTVETAPKRRGGRTKTKRGERMGWREEAAKARSWPLKP